MRTGSFFDVLRGVGSRAGRRIGLRIALALVGVALLVEVVHVAWGPRAAGLTVIALVGVGAALLVAALPGPNR